MEREELVSKVSEISKLSKEVQKEIPNVIRIGLGPDGDFKVHLMPETFHEMFKEYKEALYLTREQTGTGKDCHKRYVNIDGVEYFSLYDRMNESEEIIKVTHK